MCLASIHVLSPKDAIVQQRICGKEAEFSELIILTPWNEGWVGTVAPPKKFQTTPRGFKPPPPNTHARTHKHKNKRVKTPKFYFYIAAPFKEEFLIRPQVLYIEEGLKMFSFFQRGNAFSTRGKNLRRRGSHFIQTSHECVNA